MWRDLFLSGASDVIIEVVDLSEEDGEGAVVVVEGTKEKEAPANDIPEHTEIDDDFWEQFYAQQCEMSDSEDEEGGSEPELMFQAGGGKFAKDIHVLRKEVLEEMVAAHLRLKDDPPAWKKVVNKLRLTWHPDKNAEVFKRKAEEVLKLIENEKRRLKRGE